jgi:hypothetical protein
VGLFRWLPEVIAELHAKGTWPSLPNAITAYLEKASQSGVLEHAGKKAPA